MLALWLNLISHHRALSDDYPVLPGIAAVISSELRRAAARDSCRLFVAELEGELVGFVFAEIEGGAGPGAEPAPAWVHELWVEPDQREQGVAGQLLEEGEIGTLVDDPGQLVRAVDQLEAKIRAHGRTPSVCRR